MKMAKLSGIIVLATAVVIAALYLFDGTHSVRCTEFVPTYVLWGQFNPETGEIPTAFRWEAPRLEAGISYPLEGSWIWSTGEIWDVAGEGFVRVHPSGQDAGWVPLSRGTLICK